MDTIWFRYNVDLVIRQVPVTHINHVKYFFLFACDSMASEMNNVFRMSSEYSESDTVSSDLRALFSYFETVLHRKCPRYIVKGFLASSRSNAIRMCVIVT